jgi:hypothetical protein
LVLLRSALVPTVPPVPSPSVVIIPHGRNG